MKCKGFNQRFKSLLSEVSVSLGCRSFALFATNIAVRRQSAIAVMTTRCQGNVLDFRSRSCRASPAVALNRVYFEHAALQASGWSFSSFFSFFFPPQSQKCLSPSSAARSCQPCTYKWHMSAFSATSISLSAWWVTLKTVSSFPSSLFTC